jgi:REP element-mobilizing transposase RayT
MDLPPRRKMDHQTPEWVRHDATFFITICALPRGQNHLCHESIGKALLDSVIYYHEKQKWFCEIVVLMPDHVHLMLNFPDVPAFSPIVGDWKRWTTRRLKISWQEDFFDHRVRNEDNDKWTGDYIFHNPVRAGLVEKPEEWPYHWIPTVY